MKKILLVVQSLGIGGQEKIALNTYECLRDKYDVSFVVFHNAKVEYEHTFDVINLNVPPSKHKITKIVNQVRRILKLTTLRRKMKIDVSISFGMTANISNSLSRLFSHGKTVTSIHSFGSLKQKSILRLIAKHSDKMICIAREMQEEVLRILPKAKNTIVIENGYDVESIISKSEEHIEQELPPRSVIAMGRLAPVKAFERLIKAFAVAKKSCNDINSQYFY